MYVCIYVFPPGPHHILHYSNLQCSCQYALHRQTIAASWRNLHCTRIPHWPGVVLLVKLKGQSLIKNNNQMLCGMLILIKIKKLQPDSADSLIIQPRPTKSAPSSTCSKPSSLERATNMFSPQAVAGCCDQAGETQRLQGVQVHAKLHRISL